MKFYRCIPIAIGLPAIFGAYFFICLGCAYSCSADQNTGGVILFIFFALVALVTAAYTLVPGIRRVQILPNKILCLGLLPRHTFEIDYNACTIGMDYHLQNGNPIWWIYLCNGAPRQYFTTKKINSAKIQPGFIRIMYSDEVFEALLEVLPKKQRTSLITARRCSGFEKQGKII